MILADNIKNTAYFNFNENEEYKQFFEVTKDVKRILQNLMLASVQKILPEKTLIIFDEIQDCPKVINFTKYFCENAPQFHIACAGSLLRISLSDIIGAYERDFAKHPDVSEFPKISIIWKSIPSQLTRENKKFIYKAVKGSARAREYEDALQWLVNARLVHKIYCSSSPALPISAYDDLSAPYEVDFLIQRDNDIFPVEVKAETNTASKSLKKFKKLFDNKVKLRIIFQFNIPTNSSTPISPKSCFPSSASRHLTVTVPFSCSFSPTISI